MKIVKFRDYLVPLVISGKKNSTWRLFDDKDLSVGDEVELRESGKGKSFAYAKITKVVEKPLRDLTPKDKASHEKFENDSEMYKTFSDYCKTNVGQETNVKIIWFELMKLV